MATAVRILITVTLVYHTVRALAKVITVGTIGVFADASPRATKHSRDRMAHETGKAAWLFVGSAALNSTLIIALWVWL